MTNYYDTLGLPDYENSQESIKQAYKRARDDAEAATLPHSLHNHK